MNDCHVGFSLLGLENGNVRRLKELKDVGSMVVGNRGYRVPWFHDRQSANFVPFLYLFTTIHSNVLRILPASLVEERILLATPKPTLQCLRGCNCVVVLHIASEIFTDVRFLHIQHIQSYHKCLQSTIYDGIITEISKKILICQLSRR